MTLQTSPSSIARLLGGRALHDAARTAELHIVDQLIHERSLKLSRHPLWPLMRPFLFRIFNYHEAVRMADAIAGLPGLEAMQYLSSLLSLDMTLAGTENLPAQGSFILAPNHPTGIADGIAVFDALKHHRADMAIFANRDALRVAPGFRDLIIPVEWRAGEKSHAKSRDTLAMTARAFGDGKAVVLFPSGRIAYWNEGTLTERPWQSSAVALARRYEVPIVPAHITARNSGLFYFLAKHSTELRDMTVFHELLNKKKFGFTITFGKPIPHARLVGDPADVTAALQDHTVQRLRSDPLAVFEAVSPIQS
ncbi:1-acyl-sn-glycerol-3-phosphate acyltransferase [Aquibium sp. ELW1220]|uniref:1-acyl-sn-glycerol-3-phosphate acyltransferase n=1 Tax=Aquibium sp. ELW1220 TaxID=2976766 RepID=UPI0025AF3040|nr:1-acyl-sn-glycerol-3-phosphate acyltransferase [Aquibium sp. ELW1220]MDN2582570.1 1-acyl-sn-glycerol-3-phosphate acyltransferase [Aquibium sp. ELW1220]